MKNVIMLIRAENAVSTAVQESYCHTFAKDNNLYIKKAFYSYAASNEFDDDAGLPHDMVMDVRRDAEQNRYDGLLVYEAAKIGRDMLETSLALNWFLQKGLSIYTVQGESMIRH